MRGEDGADPTGSLNFDQLDRVELVLELDRPQQGRLHVTGRRYNLFSIVNGIANKTFA